MKTLSYSLTVFLLLVVFSNTAWAQGGADGEFVNAYQQYWQGLQDQFSGDRTDCTAVTATLVQWAERNGEAIDSLNVRSAGLTDRLSESQIIAIMPRQEPLLFMLADINSRCRNEEGFRGGMAVVNKVLGMGS